MPTGICCVPVAKLLEPFDGSTLMKMSPPRRIRCSPSREPNTYPCGTIATSPVVRTDQRNCKYNNFRNVRFGSEADICSAKRHVRFTPESGHVRCNLGCPLWANSGHVRRQYAIGQSDIVLFDHFIGAGEHRRRHCEAECLRSLKIERKFEVGSLIDRQVGWRCAL